MAGGSHDERPEDDDGTADGPDVVDLREELADQPARTWRERWAGPDRYGVLLLLIVLTIVASVVLRENRWERMAAVLLVGVMLIFAMRTSSAPTTWRAVAAAVTAAIVVSVAIDTVRGGGAAKLEAATAAAMAFLLLGVLLAILARLSSHLTVSWNTIMGALCVYLLFAMVFAAFYAAYGHWNDDILFAQQRGFTNIDTMYFSLVTLSTVGFGDLTMRADVTRILSSLEAVLGQLYLITAVGLLVGNLGRERSARRRRRRA